MLNVFPSEKKQPKISISEWSDFKKFEKAVFLQDHRRCMAHCGDLQNLICFTASILSTDDDVRLQDTMQKDPRLLGWF